MYTYAPIKGYKIDNIYYSDTDGNMKKDKLNKLIYDDNYHISRYYKENGYKNRLL